MLGIEKHMQPIDINWLFNNTQNLNNQLENNNKTNAKQNILQETTKHKKPNTKESKILWNKFLKIKFNLKQSPFVLVLS
jgi:hypothetical protein